jgi:hypothetical protein
MQYFKKRVVAVSREIGHADDDELLDEADALVNAWPNKHFLFFVDIEQPSSIAARQLIHYYLEDWCKSLFDPLPPNVDAKNVEYYCSSEGGKITEDEAFEIIAENVKTGLYELVPITKYPVRRS